MQSHPEIESLIRQCLLIPQKIYRITKRIQTSERNRVSFPGFMAFIDSTEQQIPRSTDNKRKTVLYSGEKKRYTVK